MKTVLEIVEIVENRVRNFVKMKSASKDIDQRRKKAPSGWNSVEVIRQIRQQNFPLVNKSASMMPVILVLLKSWISNSSPLMKKLYATVREPSHLELLSNI